MTSSAAADQSELRALAGAAAAADAPPAPPKPAPGAVPGTPTVQTGTAGPELAPPPGPPTGAVLAGMLAPAFMVLAPNWSVSQDECRALGEAWGAVLDHYYPGGLAQMGPWGAAVLTTAAVLGPRIAMRVPPKRLPPKPEKPAKVETPEPEPQQPESPAANDPTADGVPRSSTKYD